MEKNSLDDRMEPESDSVLQRTRTRTSHTIRSSESDSPRERRTRGSVGPREPLQIVSQAPGTYYHNHVTAYRVIYRRFQLGCRSSQYTHDTTYPIVARRVLARFEASLSRLMMVNIFEPEEPAGAAPPIAPAEPGGTAARGSRRGARGAGAKTARDPIGVWTICFGGDKEPTGAGLKQGTK